MFALFLISQHWDGTGSWNPTSWKTRTRLFRTIKSMAADDLMMHGARSSSSTVLTKFAENILLSAQGRFKNIAFQDRGTILQEEVLKKHLWVKWVWKWQFWNYIQILTGPVSSDLTQHSVIFCQKSRHFYSKKFRSSYHSEIHGVGINGVTTLLVWKIIIVGESVEV